jgi:division/cell wall cluster transcriptional repressor MraZ
VASSPPGTNHRKQHCLLWCLDWFTQLGELSTFHIGKCRDLRKLKLYITPSLGEDVGGSGKKWRKRDQLKYILSRFYLQGQPSEADWVWKGIERVMFRGNYPSRVDEKGRLKLPADFKRRVDELYGPQFYITSLDGKRAQVYPLKEWELIEASLARLSPLDPDRKKFLDVTNYYGQMVEMDGQGRLLIPQLLREMA